MDEETTPTDTYSIHCTGDVVTGDRIRFDEAVFGGSHRRPSFLGIRTIEAEVVADSYGEGKQQHTFSMVVLESSGVNKVKAGERIRRKGRNVYRRETWRAAWEDEEEREKVAAEKHDRGDQARGARAVRRREEEANWRGGF